jgi:hypothetical protein
MRNGHGTCPICWLRHGGSRHRILTIERNHDQRALITSLQRLGIGVPRRFDLADEEQRAYALLAMEDDAERRGLRVAEVNGRYVVATDLDPERVRAA